MQDRMLENKKTLPNSNWRYSPTSQNPAVLITRRVSPRKIKSRNLWWHGSRSTVELQERENFPAQVNTVALNNAEDNQPLEPFLLQVANKITIFSKLVNTFGWVKRFTE